MIGFFGVLVKCRALRVVVVTFNMNGDNRQVLRA